MQFVVLVVSGITLSVEMDAPKSKDDFPPDTITPQYTAEEGTVGAVLNASGHAQELERNFSLWSAASVGICTGNTWVALGGSIVR